MKLVRESEVSIMEKISPRNLPVVENEVKEAESGQRFLLPNCLISLIWWFLVMGQRPCRVKRPMTYVSV